MSPSIPSTPGGSGIRQLKAAQLRREMKEQAEGQAPGAEASESTATAPSEGRWHVVEQGESLDSISDQYGLSPVEVWNRPENAELRQRRGSRNALIPGDTLYLPIDEDEEEGGRGPVGQGDYVVKDGDCISSIAKDAGFFWETIWNHPPNAELKKVRMDPNVLLPGDRVTIPDKKSKEEPGDSELRHRFVLRGEPAKLSIQAVINDEPCANEPYTLELNTGQSFTGTTDPEGKLQVAIPSNARRGTLRVGPPEEPNEFELELGEMDPVSEVVGVQRRLNNLDFDCGAEDNALGAKTKDALQRFQVKHKLPPTGKPDQPTQDKLREVHGS